MPFGQCPETVISIFLEQPRVQDGHGQNPARRPILARLYLRPAILLHLELLYLFSSIFDG